MPTYQYECQSCNHQFEEFQSITAEPLEECPECEKHSLKRLIGKGGGVIFKGSGFYVNDYGRSSGGSSGGSSKSAPTPPCQQSGGKCDPSNAA